MYQLPALKFNYDDLEPFIDEETMRVHHTKHHQTYTDKLNDALAKYPELFDKDLKTLIYQAENLLPEEIRNAVINNGGGFLNHSFFWEILGKNMNEANLPKEEMINKLITEKYGDYTEFKKQFKEKALSLFGSGWTWLCLDSSGQLEIINTNNQNLLPADKKALLTLDLWEHAYYLKYQNRRAEYVEAFFEVIDWNRVVQNI